MEKSVIKNLAHKLTEKKISKENIKKLKAHEKECIFIL
jgi:hypothetical protein